MHGAGAWEELCAALGITRQQEADRLARAALDAELSGRLAHELDD
jgi:hypothetical protein